MFRRALLALATLCGLASAEQSVLRDAANASKPPNIVFILTDDQDLHLGSLDYMPNVQKHIIGKGINVQNHFGTVALCCPARATLLRGQAAHNTNITHVGGPGGGYQKWLRTGEWKNYLPLWLRDAGYTSAYFGKFMNGYSMRNYDTPPAGFDWTDILVQPYIYNFNHVVMSQNGERPVYYEGWHQTDVLRIKALDKLSELASQSKPFYLEIAPASPHVVPGGYPTVPLARHSDLFPGLKAPRLPNWNPADGFQVQKPGWLRELPSMNASVVDAVHVSMRRRIQALQGVDEIVEDVVAMLEEKGILYETYSFHLGQHRVPGGKGLPYMSDVNLPFAVRGPGIPAGKTLTVPSSHVDIVPTILEIARVPKEDWPPFLDGRGLLQEWQTLSFQEHDGVNREVLNVEFWGSTTLPAGTYTRHLPQNSYKSLRIISSDGRQGYLFNRWCFSNETELYDTTADPYELTNLALDPSTLMQQLMNRLSGLLLVTKSCGRDTCRKPWEVLRADCGADCAFTRLEEAMKKQYDDFFTQLPHFGFKECLPFQAVENEGPYYPPESISLGHEWRELTVEEDVEFWVMNGTAVGVGGENYCGDEAQRLGKMGDVISSARELTDEEIGWPVERCDGVNEYCGWKYGED